MVKLSDVAKKAGVNSSTVSRALNDSSEINIETKKKIYKIANELGYFEKKKKTNTILLKKTVGIIVPEMVNFFLKIVNTIQEKLSREGYSAIISITNFSDVNEKQYLDKFIDMSVDGILIFLTNDSIKEVLENLQNKCNIPLVQLGLFVENYDCVTVDFALEPIIAIEHLKSYGHKNIGYIGEVLSDVRFRNLKNEFEEFGLVLNDEFVKVGKERFQEGGYKRMKEILDLKERPTAIIAAYDDIAIGAMRAIYEAGIKIPEDISIIGFDNSTVTPYLYNSLTTVSTPTDEWGSIASRILLDRINNNENAVQHVLLKPKLIIRETTSIFNEYD